MNITNQKDISSETVAEIELKSFYINVVEDYKDDLSYEE